MMMTILFVLGLMQGGSSMPMRSLEHSSQTFIENSKQVAIRTPEEWTALWQEHAANRPAPVIDFTREMVIGVFLGTRNSAGYGVEIVGVQKDGAGAVVKYRETSPARGMMTAQVITSPYHLVVVPKTEGAVRFEKTAP
jgi:hypothetical protein